MKIFVCAKQVPDTTGKVVVNEDGTLNRSKMENITNPDDLHGLECALQLKQQENAEVVVLTMGPPTAEDMLRELLAMGADSAYLVSDRKFGGSDTFGTSQILAAAIKKIGFSGEDLILCGKQATDGDTAQVGSQIAEHLGITQITYAISVKKTENQVEVIRELENKMVTVKGKLPCLITCSQGLNLPRFMNMSDIFTCFQKEIKVFQYDDLENQLIDSQLLGLEHSPTRILKSFTPPKKGSKMIAEGNGKEACVNLVNILVHEQRI